jgi:glycosyl-4,4'-diaponeurosporenoate acyltransferase
MRVFYFTQTVTLILDVGAWFVIHMTVGLLGLKIPLRLIRPDLWLYRARKWESNGKFYQKVFKIQKWKHLLPDGGNWFKNGFPKRKLLSSDHTYLMQFTRETCRGELTHWLAVFPALLFFLWNDWWVSLIMIGYALAVNLPCIITQRYNRIRFSRLLAKISSVQANPALCNLPLEQPLMIQSHGPPAR